MKVFAWNVTSTRQISKPAVLPAFEKAGCITVGREFLFPWIFEVGAGVINPVVRPPVVAPKQSFANDITSKQLFNGTQNNVKNITIIMDKWENCRHKKSDKWKHWHNTTQTMSHCLWIYPERMMHANKSLLCGWEKN